MSDVRATNRWLENRDRGRAAGAWRRFKQILWLRFSRMNAPMVYPWSPSRNGDGVNHELHRKAAALLGDRVNGGVERLWLWTKAVGWPVIATITAVPLVLKCGGVARARCGLGYVGQFKDVLNAAWKHGIFPAEYYQYRVFDGALRNDKSAYLNQREVLALISVAGREPDSDRVNDLRGFYSICREAGFEVPKVLAVFDRGEIGFRAQAGPNFLPEKDLFVRPEKWRDGENGELWRWNARARVWSFRREALGGLALVERWRKLSNNRVILIQEALNNHPDMARFSSGGFCTMRIGTGMDLEGNVQPLFATLQLPAANQGGWLAPTGVLSAGINIENGSLAPAMGEFLSDGDFHSHPETGAIIDGATVPQWNLVLDLALRAHQQFPTVPFIGWEIGFSGAGPVIVEAGTNWGVFRHVIPTSARFVGLCRERLAEVHPECAQAAG